MKREKTHYNRSGDFKTNYYVDGNTVRRLEGEPEERRQRQLEEEQERKKRRNRRVAKRNQERAMRMSLGYVLTYIRLQSDIVGRTKNISKLESQIMNLQAENDAAVKRIDLSTDLDAVREQAFALGMKFATPEQIIYYTIKDSDFMDQYSEIPEK